MLSDYNTKDNLRELIHRERSAEFAGEGQRHFDIIR
ncbi:RagB/SusD family nutrient uptake outer membrane protein [Segatella asaccharophila]